MEKNTTVVVVDARSRERKVFTASATQLSADSSAIVLRKGVEVGGIWTLHGKNVEHPILIVGSYAAKSSYGHVTPLGAENFDSVTWIGGAGFGFIETKEDEEEVRRGYGLRPFGRPLKAVLIPVGARVEAVETHGNSNAATANAALEGLCLKVKANSRLFILAEGQSDYTAATLFDAVSGKETPEFPEEHRGDIFSSEKILDAAMRRLAKGDEGQRALNYAILRAAVRAGKHFDFAGPLPSTVHDLLYEEEIEMIVEERVSALEAEGWEFGFDMELANHFTRAVAPDGKVTSGVALFMTAPEVGEAFLELGTLNSEEEKCDMRISNLAGRLTQFFWYDWGTKPGITGLDKLVVAGFRDGTEDRLWFSEVGSLGPNGEPDNGHRWLSAFDSRGEFFWDRLLKLEKMTVTAYNREGQAESRVWEATAE